jgi:hypothetical protein
VSLKQGVGQEAYKTMALEENFETFVVMQVRESLRMGALD